MHSHGFLQSIVAYNTLCTDTRLDVLVDMQDPISSLTPWIFSKLGTSKDFFLSAADKTGDCEHLYLTAPDCSATSFVNQVKVDAINPNKQSLVLWNFIYEPNLDVYYLRTTQQTCPNNFFWLLYDPTIGDNGYFRLATDKNRSAFKLPNAQQTAQISLA